MDIVADSFGSDRKARRGELDFRYDFLFQVAAEGCGITKQEVVDHLLQDVQIKEIHDFILKDCKKTILLYHQLQPSDGEVFRNADPLGSAASTPRENRRLVIADGLPLLLDGTCTFVLRLNPKKVLTEDNVHRDLVCGVLEGFKDNLVYSLRQLMNHIYKPLIECLVAQIEEVADKIQVYEELVMSTQSFCSVLKASEHVMSNKISLLDTVKGPQLILPEDSKKRAEASREPENRQLAEKIGADWINLLEREASESEMLRRDCDEDGPRDEIEYWKVRLVRLHLLQDQLQLPQVQGVLLCLQVNRCKLAKRWLEAERKLMFCRHESKDNVRYLSDFDNYCKTLYVWDPVRILTCIRPLLHTVRMICCTSQYYNTSERVTSLLVKITNQLIRSCRMHVTCHGKDTVWSRPPDFVRPRLLDCLKLHEVYREAYVCMRQIMEAQQASSSHPIKITCSEHSIFGKFDSFCKRVHKILHLFDVIEQHSAILKGKMEGLLLDEEILQEIMRRYTSAVSDVSSRPYDYLSYRQEAFEQHLAEFEARLYDLKLYVGNYLERTYDEVWETPQNMRFLAKFERVSQVIPLGSVEVKFARMIAKLTKEIEKIGKVFARSKDDPPIPRQFPPTAGRVVWSRGLYRRLEQKVLVLASHPTLLASEVGKEVVRKYNGLALKLVDYQLKLTKDWDVLSLREVQECLSRHIVAKTGDELVTFSVHFASPLLLLFREVDCCLKAEVHLPLMPVFFYGKRNSLLNIRDLAQYLLERYQTSVESVDPELAPLLSCHIHRLSLVFHPVVNWITWGNSPTYWQTFFLYAKHALDDFDTFVSRLESIRRQRILGILDSMHKVSPCPGVREKPWLLEEFVEATKERCRQAAFELQQKNLLMEAATLELLDLICTPCRHEKFFTLTYPPDIVELKRKTEQKRMVRQLPTTQSIIKALVDGSPKETEEKPKRRRSFSGPVVTLPKSEPTEGHSTEVSTTRVAPPTLPTPSAISKTAPTSIPGPSTSKSIPPIKASLTQVTTSLPQIKTVKHALRLTGKGPSKTMTTGSLPKLVSTGSKVEIFPTLNKPKPGTPRYSSMTTLPPLFTSVPNGGNAGVGFSVKLARFEADQLKLRQEELVASVLGAARDFRRTYCRRILDVIVRLLRGQLDVLKRIVIMSPAPALMGKKASPTVQGSNTHLPMFIFHACLVSPNIEIVPTLDEFQEALAMAGKVILGVAKGLSRWSSQHSKKDADKRHDWDELVACSKDPLYKSTMLDRVAMPTEPQNLYPLICEQKDVVKGLSLMSACIHSLKANCAESFKLWESYRALWQKNRQLTIKEFMSRNPTTWEFDNQFHYYRKLEATIAAEPDLLCFATLHVSTEKLKASLLQETEKWTSAFARVLHAKCSREMERMLVQVAALEKRLDRRVLDLEDTRIAMETLKNIRNQEVDMDMALETVDEAIGVLLRYHLPIQEDEVERVDGLRFSWHRLQSHAQDLHAALVAIQPQFRQQLMDNLTQFKEDCVQFCREYRENGPMVVGLSPRDASDRLLSFQNRFDTLWRRHGSYAGGAELFGIPLPDIPELTRIKKELSLLQKLYRLYNDVIDRVTAYYDIAWGEVNIEEINNELVEFQNRCRKLPKGLKEWPAFNALKRTIDDFSDLCPLLELMTNKAMKPRHWQRLTDITGHVFEVDSEGFCLRSVVQAPLLQHKEDVEDVCISALKEKDIEAKLRQVTNDWTTHQLTFMSFKNRGELLLRGDTAAETISQLDDSLMVLSSLLSNRYNAPFRKQIQKWVTDLSNTNEVLERWLCVQNLWVYLEAVFVGGDIAKQLPKEAKRFHKIDKAWQRIMARAHETPNVVLCCVSDDTLMQLLPHLQEELELCQKSLSGYLEKKRLTFPRFFFVSDPALLEILGQASDSHTIQSHLLSIFDNTASVRFHDTEYDKILAIVSSEGESITLEQPVRAEGSVELWIMRLLQEAQKSLHSIIRLASQAIENPDFNLLDFLGTFPSQVGILGIQMIWTKESEVALSQAKYDRKIMAETNSKFLDMLNTLIDQTTRNLNRLERIKYETLITIHVHQRDIFDYMCRLNVRSVSDFEWTKQFRFYFKQELDKTWISITDVNFTYQNEFLGCTERLVITPLTDRCYITLAQALHMSMGGCPTGPAGTGKTETTKDMGKTLGKYVVVFNCSDQMDFRGLGRIIKGLCQSGAWGCFDEFNRIDLSVLSVAAQQVAVVLTCKREKRKQLVFTDGDTIEMNPEFGIFLTMNPGYAGRQALPENLKILFRTVAMMVPDRQIIIRVKLASCGFLENITLARKFYTLYKLCEEQLTKQVHYDFGLRNILSVLRTLGSAKRASVRDSESMIVMRVLRDMNLSKLVDEDEPLFMSLIGDLFPSTSLEKTSYPDLEAAIQEQIKIAGLVAHPPWMLKLIQLYETQRVRHGIMTLGPSGAGKTTCIQTLMRALTAIGETHKELRMNPKAITVAQMFGRLDVATNDWTDGIFSALWRKTLKMKKTEHVWIVLDGPVDSIWIENLNSVLDDNRTLTLANGDRLPMPSNLKIIFEPHNIDNASPATVSRCGMVYMSSSGLDWKPLLQAWLVKRPQYERNLFKKLFDESFPIIYQWTIQSLPYKMQVLECNVINQAVLLLEGLIPKPELDERELLTLTSIPTTSTLPVAPPTPPPGSKPGEEEPATEEGENSDPSSSPSPAPTASPTHLGRLYVFAIMWSIGAFLEREDRTKLEAFMFRKFPLLLYPPVNKNRGENMFDYVVGNDGEWQHWESRLGAFSYPDTGTLDYASYMIPNVDSVRTEFLIHTIAKQGKPVLLIGEQGSAKTAMMEAFMKHYNPEYHVSRKFNFSSATTPYQFQRTIESYVDKRMGSTYGPPAGKKLTIFIDDINLPYISDWGDQITNEIVRQLFEMRGFYSLEKPGDFLNVIDLQFLGAMIQPGGGRNDIPSRLKRHFCIFNCPLPSEASIDRVFSTIALGHYNAKRGFAQEVRQLVEKLIPVTRHLWMTIKAKMLPTPAKFHYVFNLRDLSRIWQGMTGTLATVVDSQEVVMALWKHECTRVIADRFTVQEDKDWFDTAMTTTVRKHLGEKMAQLVEPVRFFVDFMRDAPEPTGDETEDAEMEMPKVYEPVNSCDVLVERLQMFLAQYNEMVRGTGMDLVFFQDAVLHLIKISRILRHPGGNVLLVGVGGSGKQSLTKLASFIAGYKTFHITLTRSYNVSNFIEDLKVLYRTCGIQGKGTTFIFTEQDVKEEAFLEYLNSVLSAGTVSSLFNRDEQAEIISELSPIMKREYPKRSPTQENVMDYFLTRVRQNLHIALCFSPVGEKFRTRALKFPGLVSGCIIDWFQPWPREALVAVARHFLSDLSRCIQPHIKSEVEKSLGSIQESVAEMSREYFQRYRRATHVTPKTYLGFLSSYKTVFSSKTKEIGGLAARMETGLSKLQEASESVERLKAELAVMERDLAQASETAEKVLVEVTNRAKEAETTKNTVQTAKDRSQKLVDVIAAEKAVAEEKLTAARPALEEAEAALNTIKPAHIATVRKLGRPPQLIMRIMDCVLILFQRKLQPVQYEVNNRCIKPSWNDSLKFMSSTTFLQQLQNFPKDSISDEVVEFLEPYFRSDDYNMETARRVCGDVAGLLSWTRAMAFFFGVNKEVLPLKANLALQETRLNAAMTELARAEAILSEKENALDFVTGQYDAAIADKQRLTEAAATCRRKMAAAGALISGLSGEKLRWTLQCRAFKEQMGRLVGDALLATAFLSYSGPFNQEFRGNLMTSWRRILKLRDIPFSQNLNVTFILVENNTVAEWTLQGLPNDEHSIQNAVIVTKASSYPLLIDPQGQGKLWIKAKEACNELQITSLNHKYFRSHLEDSLSLGRPLLVEDVSEELDPILDNLLDKNFIKSGSVDKVVIGDKDCDVMPGFMLYMTTKLPNPAYTPEVSAKVSIIDFTVTRQGLEDQLLGRVVLMERSELEAERVTVFEAVMENKRTIKELEDNLLCRLTSTEGSLIDDEGLVTVLHETKHTAQEVAHKLSVAADTEQKINLTREEYRPVATRGSVLYFLIVEMSQVNVMYQTSLRQFLNLFDGSIAKALRSQNVSERVHSILNTLNREVWYYTLRGLYEQHKLLFTILLAIKIDLHSGQISHQEFMTFIKGGASLDLNNVPAKPFKWILDIAWLNLVELSSLPPFADVLQQVVENERDWRIWAEKERPEQEEIPCGYSKSIDSFRKLLLVRSWCPDRMLHQAHNFVTENLGPEYHDAPMLDLEAMLAESDPKTPFVCLLSTCSDPSQKIEQLARQKEIEVRSLSMGQGQEIHARRMLIEGMAAGSWLLLQNCHLSLPFCVEVMELIQECDPIQPQFRLWLTTEVHPQFPIGLLQTAIKFTNEPPQGIRASLRRTYNDITQDLLDYSPSPYWPLLLYALSYLHTVLQERRKYGALGWNIPYEFNQSDLAACIQCVQNHLDDMDPKRGISWPTVCYMLGEAQYGGRVTDDFDKRLLLTFTQSWFNDRLLQPNFDFHKEYRLPPLSIARTLQGSIEHINDLPGQDTPEALGLHPNADITYQINRAQSILDTILSIQPKEGGSRGGETRESMVSRLAEDMLDKMPKNYVPHEVKESLHRLGALYPMTIFLRQEIDRMQRVLKLVRSTLTDLRLAIEGTIIMSPNLRKALDSMYDARVPDAWRNLSWESSTLGFWFTEFLERNAQYQRWCFQGKPKVFWMAGFFNPQGFLTAMRQEVTRAHRGWALDSVVLQSIVTRLNKDDVMDAPPEGVYIHGLYLEGASLDRKNGRLVEPKAKILYEPMPVIYVYAINSTAGKDPRMYECPIYRKPQRGTGMYIGSIDLETDVNPRHWALRGVALLCDIK